MTKPLEPDTAPRSVRERGAYRRLGQLGFVLVALVMYVLLNPVLRDWGIPTLLRWPLWAAIVSTWLLPYAMLYGTFNATRYEDARVSHPAILASACTVSATALVLLFKWRGFEVALLGSTPALAVYACVVWADAFRHARSTRRIPAQRRLRAETADEAQELVADCERELRERPLRDDERVVVELNLAGALIAQCRSGDRDDLMPRALEILDGVRTASTPQWRLAATELLLEAMTVKALRSGDLDGYENTLGLLLQAATDAASVIEGAPAAAHGARAKSLAELGDQAEGDGRMERAASLHARAATELGQALELSAPRSPQHALHTIALAGLALADPPHQDLDTAIRACGRALRRLSQREWAQRAPGLVTLADLLTKRALKQPSGGIGRLLDGLWSGRPKSGPIAALWPERSTHDLARASLLCQRLALRDALASEGRARLPELAYLLRSGQMSYVMGPGRRQIAFMYRLAFTERTTVAPGRASDLAAKWATWAAAGGQPQRAAEAYWYWIGSVVADARRRIFLEDKERSLAHIQGHVAEACMWLVEAGRARDAAVALETGRAVLLTERMSRDRPGLEQRLIDAGREDLRERWHEARDRVAGLDRAGFAAPAGAVRRPEGDSLPEGLASIEYLALAGHEQLLREIAEVPGCENVRAAPAYDELRAAAADGPLVYVCATDGGGCALIVTNAPQPVVVKLPSLRSADVEAHANELLAATTAHGITEELFDQLPWLWTHAMQPIRQRLEPGALVTVIAAGALGMLPLQFAGPAPEHLNDPWQQPADGLVIRFAPNARVLLQAQATALELAGSDARLLTVAAPRVPGMPTLRFAEPERDGVRARFGADRTECLDPPTVDAILAALDRCTIWHFACHGKHDPDEPLDGRLLLHDGDPLTLRAIFARRSGRARLAVLSACQTAISDRTLLDEVISFPSALLQAGVAGIISAHARVPDQATMLLVLRFFDLLDLEIPPARALLQAQTWLASATNEAIRDAIGDAYRMPAAQSADELEAWKRARPFARPHNWSTFSYSGA